MLGIRPQSGLFNPAHGRELARAVCVVGIEIRRRENHDHAHAFAKAPCQRLIIEVSAFQSKNIPINAKRIDERLQFAGKRVMKIFDEAFHQLLLAVPVADETGMLKRHWSC